MFKAIIKTAKNKEGEFSLGRIFAWTGAAGLTFGFYRESLTNGLEWQDYIAYAVAMTVMYAPAKAIDLIRAIKGDLTPEAVGVTDVKPS